MSSIKRKSDELQQSIRCSGNKYGYLKEIHTKHKIKRQRFDVEQPKGKNNVFVISIYRLIDHQNEFFDLENNQKKSAIELVGELGTGNESDMQYELFDVEDDKFYRGKQ